jgi:tetratricopeptide (TPR) repeat protein
VSQATQASIDNNQEYIDSYTEQVTRNPNDTLALRGLGDTYVNTAELQGRAGLENEAARNYKNAVDAYRKALAVKEDPEIRIDLGWAYLQMNMIDVAERELKTVIGEAPTSQRAWHTLGFLYANVDRGEEAKNAWQQAYNIDATTAIGQEAKKFLDEYASPNASLTPPAVGP